MSDDLQTEAARLTLELRAATARLRAAVERLARTAEYGADAQRDFERLRCEAHARYYAAAGAIHAALGSAAR